MVPTSTLPGHSYVSVARQLILGLLATAILGLSPTHSVATEVSVCSSCTHKSIYSAIHAQGANPAGVTIAVSGGPYREIVDTEGKDGSYGDHFVLKAVGTVVIDGSDPYNDTGLWTQYNGDSTFYTTDTSGVAPPDHLVLVDDVPYQYVAGSAWGDLHTGQWGYDAGASRIYMNVGSANPGTKQVYIGSRDYGFDIDNSNYLTIDGFTVLRANSKGIDIRGSGGSHAISVVVKNCTVSRSRQQGFLFKDVSRCTLRTNVSSYNGDHGIQVGDSDTIHVVSNTSIWNDDPWHPRGGSAGIRTGYTADSTKTHHIAIDYNTVHHNEDTGIDLAYAQNVVARRNVSYFNRDHGFDNNHGTNYTWLNNTAWRNDHDGMSVEKWAHSVTLYNNILARNGVDPTTLAGGPGNVRELFVDSLVSFISDYNIMWPLKTGSVSGGGERHVAEIQQGSSQIEYDTFAAYVAGTTNLDEASHSSDPVFADTGTANFIIAASTSDAVDGGKSDATGWLSPWVLTTDPRGFVIHDVDGESGGAGSPAYLDRGAYEYDAPPGAPTIDEVLWGRNNIAVNWEAQGDDGSSGTAGMAYAMVSTFKDSNYCVAPLETQCVDVGGLTACTSYNTVQAQVRERDNKQTVMSTNSVNGTTSCLFITADCFSGFVEWQPGDEEESMRGLAAVAAEFALALEQAYPNPSHGRSLVRWSFSRTERGLPFELSLFDVAGRRVATLAKGIAEMGNHEGKLFFAPEDGAGLRNGAYFLRMQVGDRTLRRTVVLAR